jgi:hypothetical protein
MTQPPSTATTLSPNPEVVSRRLGDGAVLVHLSTNKIFELNDTGARIWQLISERATEDRIVENLVHDFEVDAEQATQEVLALVARLRAEGLLGQ